MRRSASHVTTTTEPGAAPVSQRRMAGFAGWAALGVAFVGFIEAVTEIITGSWAWATHAAAGAVHQGSALLLALGWLWLRRPRASPISIDAVDGFLVIGATTLLGLQGALDPDPNHLILVVLSQVACLVVAHALFVGGGLAGTTLISVAALAPIVVAYVVMLSHMPKMDVSSLATHTVRTTLAMLLVVVMAVFGAMVSGRLSHERMRNRLLGKYRLGEPLGRGGMGVVHRAYHVFMRRPVAIKLLCEERHDSEYVRRFEREVQLTSQLNHPNTIAIYDYGATPDGWPYYVMELVEGWSLEELVKETGPLPPDRTISILEQVCASLTEAHELGMVHRDIKPSNIILSHRGGVPDFVKVLDFGLVQTVSPAPPDGALISDGRTIKGTPAYMAPEAVIGNESVSPQTDLYSLGAVGYFLLTGTPVFRSPSVVEAFADQIHTAPERPSARLGRSLPQGLEQLVLRCLEKFPQDRPPSARVLRAELSACRTNDGWSERDAEQWWKDHPPPLGSPGPALTTSTVGVALDSRRTRWPRGKLT
jgi:hypothetical protein